MANKVYILMYGFDDDRRIGGVYSTRAGAEAAMRFGDEYTTIEEVGVDLPLPKGPAEGCLWYVEYSKRPPEFVAYREASFDGKLKTDVVRLCKEVDLMIHLWARDQAEATLLAAEHFRHYLTAKGATDDLARMEAEFAASHA